MEAVKRDASIEAVLAITSSGSIAGWVIWSKAQFIWASLIALSQLINTIKPYLPYQKRIRSLEALNQQLNDLLLDMEHEWYFVSEGERTNEEIHRLIIEMKRKKNKVLSLYLTPNPLPFNKQFLKQAENKAQNSHFLQGD